MECMSLEEEISFLFSSWRIIDELYYEYAKSVGLTSLGLLILDTIYAMPENCTQKELCEKTNLPKQTVNVIIKSLWKQGYIELKEIDTDRRNKSIQLSASGREYGDRVIGKLIETEKKIIGDLTYEQRQGIIQFLKKAEMYLKEIVEED